MSRWTTFARRWLRARRYGVAYRGVTHTRPPLRWRQAGVERPLRLPDEPLIGADFINVVLDDEYGLRALRAAPATVVDVGGNVGSFTNFARELFPQAVIHAYEPSPGNVEYLRFNTTHPRTTVFEEGVAGEDGAAAMVELGAAILARTEKVAGGAIKLTAFATVLQRIGGAIDLLKVDCEGAEWDFMTDPALFANVGTIRMEYHLVDGRTLDDLHAMARTIGFKVAKLAPNTGFGIAWLERA